MYKLLLKYSTVIILFFSCGCMQDFISQCPSEQKYNKPDIVYPKPILAIIKQEVRGNKLINGKFGENFYTIVQDDGSLPAFELRGINSHNSQYITIFYRRPINIEYEFVVFYDQHHPILFKGGLGDQERRCGIIRPTYREGVNKKSYFINISESSPFKGVLRSFIWDFLYKQRELSKDVLHRINRGDFSINNYFANQTADLSIVSGWMEHNIRICDQLLAEYEDMIIVGKDPNALFDGFTYSIYNLFP